MQYKIKSNLTASRFQFHNSKVHYLKSFLIPYQFSNLKTISRSKKFNNFDS